MRATKRSLPGEGELRQRPDGRWEKRVRVDGQRISFYGKTAAIANNQWRAWMKNQAAEAAASANMTLRELAERFLDKELPKRSPSPRTTENYLWSVGHIVTFCPPGARAPLGGRPLRGSEALSVDDVDDLLEGKTKTLARLSVSRIRSHLIEILNYGIARDHLDRNVASITRVPPGREREGRAMTPDQALSFVKALRGHRLEAMYLLDLMALTRPGEGLGVCWDDLDIDGEGSAVQVRQMLKLLPGSKLVLGDVKTKKSARGIDLAEEVNAALVARRAAQAVERRLAGAAWRATMPDAMTGKAVPNTLVFTTRTGGPISHGYVRRKLKELTQSIGLGQDWTTYDLRTTGASLLIDAGVSMDQVSDLMGHTTNRTLETRYRKRVRPTNASAAAPMHRLLRQSADP